MRGILAFDGRCGFCTGSRDLLVRLDRHSRVETVAYQHPGATARTGLTMEQLATSVWWLGDDGLRRCGAEAVNAALSAALGSQLPLRLYGIGWVRHLQDAAYRWVARHRQHFPGTIPWCQAHPEECRSRHE